MMAIVLTVSFINMDSIVKFRQDHFNKVIIGSRVDLAFYTIIFGALCTIMPIFELYGFRNRRNLDTMFTLPVSRTKMLFAHLLNGWIHVIVAFTAEVVIIFSALRQEKDWVNESYILGYYFGFLAVGLAIYLFFSFIFLQGNTIIDGIVFMGAWSFAFMLPFLLITEFAYYLNRLHNGGNYYELCNRLSEITESMCVYSPFGTITNMAISKMGIKYQDYTYMYKTAKLQATIGVTFWCVIGVVCLILLCFTFRKQRVEKVEDISNSPIGYKFLIPFYIICLILWITEFAFVACALIAMLVAYIIYRRTFKIKKWDIIMIGITVSIAIIAGLLK
jgi:hypothetical protein